MQKSFTITGSDNALEAASWCMENLDDEDWQLDFKSWDSNGSYTFTINDPKYLITAQLKFL